MDTTPTRQLYVRVSGAVPPDERYIDEIFSKFGRLKGYRFLYPRRDAAVVSYTNTDDACKALEKLNGHSWQGINFDISWNRSSRLLCIDDVPKQLTSEAVEQILHRNFSRFGHIDSITFRNDRRSVYVLFSQERDALSAVRALQEHKEGDWCWEIEFHRDRALLQQGPRVTRLISSGSAPVVPPAAAQPLGAAPTTGTNGTSPHDRSHSDDESSRSQSRSRSRSRSRSHSRSRSASPTRRNGSQESSPRRSPSPSSRHSLSPQRDVSEKDSEKEKERETDNEKHSKRKRRLSSRSPSPQRSSTANSCSGCRDYLSHLASVHSLPEEAQIKKLIGAWFRGSFERVNHKQDRMRRSAFLVEVNEFLESIEQPSWTIKTRLYRKWFEEKYHSYMDKTRRYWMVQRRKKNSAYIRLLEQLLTDAKEDSRS